METNEESPAKRVQCSAVVAQCRRRPRARGESWKEPNGQGRGTCSKARVMEQTKKKTGLGKRDVLLNHQPTHKPSAGRRPLLVGTLFAWLVLVLQCWSRSPFVCPPRPSCDWADTGTVGGDIFSGRGCSGEMGSAKITNASRHLRGG